MKQYLVKRKMKTKKDFEYEFGKTQLSKALNWVLIISLVALWGGGMYYLLGFFPLVCMSIWTIIWVLLLFVFFEGSHVSNKMKEQEKKHKDLK